MEVIIIAAVAENGAIGKDNDLIWHLPDDMSFFKKTTSGKPVIMGRRNYESIPHKYRPLPNRKNIIVTRNADYQAEGAFVTTSVKDAIDLVKNEPEIFVIGGGEIYKLALEQNLINKMYLTEIHESFEADTFFPDFQRENWNKRVLSEHGVDSKHLHAFTIVEYSKK